MNRPSLRLITRGAAVTAGAAGLSMLATAPAGALDSNGQQGQTVSQPILLWLTLIGVPLLVILVIALIVFAPGWTQSGRYDGSTGWLSDPLWLGQSGEAKPAIGSGPADGESSSADPGGVSAGW